MADKKELTADQQAELDEIFARARAALAIIETYDQARVDRLCQAVAWAVSNKVTFTRLVAEGIEESGLGDPVSRMGKRMKIRGILRDALRAKSVGIVEELPEKGIVKYGKPAGIGSGKSGETGNQGCFPGTIGAEQSEELAFGNVQGHAGKCGQRAEALLELFNGNGNAHGVMASVSAGAAQASGRKSSTP